jgi:hypothetical protein
MRRTALLIAVATALAVPAVVHAQSVIQAGSITLGYSNNNGCNLSARQLVIANNGTEVQFSYRNNGSNWISFGVQAALTLSGGNRTISTTSFTDPRGPNADGVVRITGISPAITGSLSAASVTIVGCSTAPAPGGPPRNWR